MTPTPGLAGEASDMSDRKGLFSRMARSALPRQFSAPTHPTRSGTREPVLETVEATPDPITMMEAEREEDLLEIPAFLRRQTR